jgi:hypothetical protein
MPQPTGCAKSQVTDPASSSEAVQGLRQVHPRPGQDQPQADRRCPPLRHRRERGPVKLRPAFAPASRRRPVSAGHSRTSKRTAPHRIRTGEGLFPQGVAGVGFDQRRLSRRFYSALAPPDSPPADQRIRRSRRVCGPPPSAIRPWVPGSGVRAGHGRARTSPRTGAEKATDGAGGSGCTDRPPGF